MQPQATVHLNVIQSLYKAFDHFNQHFNGDDLLATPVINLGPAGRRAAYGWFRPNSWFSVQSENKDTNAADSDNLSLPEINISPEYLYRKPNDVLETLLHEMAHLHNNVLGIRDCNKAQYHNKKFKEQAENYGLCVEKMRNKGWALTSLDQKGKAAIDTLPFDKDVFKVTRPRPLSSAENPYITITLRKDLWEQRLEDMKELHGLESNGEVIKHALENLEASQD